MRRPVLRWAEPMPGEVRAVCEPYMEQLLRFAPSWLHDVHVRWDGTLDREGKGDILTITTKPEYREVTITVGPHILTTEPDQRAERIAHEFAHLPFAQIDDFVEDLLATVKDAEPKTHSVLSEQYRRLLEGAVCDLTRALLTSTDAQTE